MIDCDDAVVDNVPAYTELQGKLSGASLFRCDVMGSSCVLAASWETHLLIRLTRRPQLLRLVGEIGAGA